MENPTFAAWRSSDVLLDEKENFMDTPSKRGTGDIGHNPASILKRKVLSTIAERESAVKRAKKKARRSLGRRVSFAPDAELETRHLYEKDEYAGGTSLEALEALIRARMETNPSLGGGGDLVNTGVHGLPALAADPVIMVPLENAPPGVSAAAARGVSPQRLWMDLASPSGPVPMSLAGNTTQFSCAFLPGDTGPVRMEEGATTEATGLEGFDLFAAARGGGDVTRGVPSLADVAAADEAEDPFAASSGAAVQLAPLADTPTRVLLRDSGAADSAGITAAVPDLAALVDLDEVDAPDVEPSPLAGGITAVVPGLAALVDLDAADGAMSPLVAASDGGAAPLTGSGALSPAVTPSPEASPPLVDTSTPASARARGPAARRDSFCPPSADLTGQLQRDAGTPADSVAQSVGSGQQSSGGGPRRASLEPDVQLNKWGFVPGGDDTLELNLTTKGRLMMGEATYNHVFVDAEAGDATRRLALAVGGGGAMLPTPTGPSPARTAAPGLDTDDDEPAQGEAALESLLVAIKDNVDPLDAAPGKRGAEDTPTERTTPNAGAGGRRLSLASRRSRRRSSFASGLDLTGGLLRDRDDEDGTADLPVGTPASGGAAGRQQMFVAAGLTDGLLLLGAGAPAADAAADGPLQNVKRWMQELHFPENGHTGKLLADGGTTAAVAAVPLLEGAATMTAGLGRSGSSAGPQTLDLLGPGGTTALLGPLGGPEDTEAGPSAPAVHADGGSQDGGTPGPERLPESLLDQTMDGLEVPPEPDMMQLDDASPVCSGSNGSPRVAALMSSASKLRGGAGPRTPLGELSVERGVDSRLPTAQSPAAQSPVAPISGGQVWAFGTPPSSGAARAPPAAAYPVPAADAPPGSAARADRIPGGPKLARTPVSGRPPLTPAMAAQLGRTPGSTAAPTSAGGARFGQRFLQHGGVFPPTPSVRQTILERVTFQDFCKEVDIFFHDHMRGRGTSLNFADLASDPPPANLQARARDILPDSEAYRLLCIVSPEVAQFEKAITTLQAEIRTRKASIAEKEAALAANNPPLFQQIQVAGTVDAEAIKASVAALKKVCRQRTMVAWKEWRASMEAHCGALLRESNAVLEDDAAFLADAGSHLAAVRAHAERFAAEVRAAVEAEARLHAVELQDRRNLVAMRGSLAEQRAANGQREARFVAADARRAELQATCDELAAQRAALTLQADELEAAAAAGAGEATDQRPDAARAAAALENLERMDIAAGCLGWRLEAGSGAAMPGAVLRLGDLFRLRIDREGGESGSGSGSATLQLTAPHEAPRVAAGWRALAAALVAGPEACDAESAPVGNFASPLELTRLVRTTAAACADATALMAEAARLRLACPALTAVSPLPAERAIALTFLNIEKQLRFSVRLPLGRPERDCTPEVQYRGATTLEPADISAAVAGVAPGRGWLRRACSALSALAADPPSASPGSGTTPDVRTLLAAAAADLEAAKQRRAALVAEPPAGPAEVPAILASAGPAVARHEAADANMRGLPAEGCAAVDAAADAVAADELHVSVAVATEEDADQEERETPAAAALLMIGADAVSLPGAAGTAEGASVMPPDRAVAAQEREPSPPESPAAADKENTPPGKPVADGSPLAKPGSPSPAFNDGALTASPPAAVESSVVAVVGSTSCSPDKGGSASGPAASHMGGAAAEVGKQGGAVKDAPPDVGSEAADGDGVAANGRRGAFKSMSMFCNPLYSTA